MTILHEGMGHGVRLTLWKLIGLPTIHEDSNSESDVGLLAFMLGFLLWFYFVSRTRIEWVDPENPLGLYGVLPVTFWVALCLMVLGLVICIRSLSDSLYHLLVLAFFVALWGTPVFVEPNARIPDTWAHFSNSVFILQEKGFEVASLNTTEFPPRGYLSWPGAFILGAELLSITGLQAEVIVHFFPLLFIAVFVQGLFALTRSLSPAIWQHRAVILLIALANLWPQTHFSPQTVGLSIFPIVLLCFYKLPIDYRLGLVGFFLLVVLNSIHPVTSFYAFVLSPLMVTGGFLVQTDRRKDPMVPKALYGLITRSRREILFFILTCSLFSLLFILWWIYSASKIPNVPSPLVVLHDLGVGYPVLDLVKARAVSPASVLRILIIVFFAIGAILATVILFLRKRWPNLILFGGWVGLCAVTFLVEVAVSWGEFSDRPLLFVFLGIPFLIVAGLSEIETKKLRRYLFIILLILSLVGNATRYAGENVAIIPETNLTAADFAVRYLQDREVFGGSLNTIQTIDPDFHYYSVHYRLSSALNPGTIIFLDKHTMSSGTPTAVSMEYAATWGESNYAAVIYMNMRYWAISVL